MTGVVLGSCRLRISKHAMPAALGIGVGLTPGLAYAYIDPGIAYVALQGALALLFGAGLAWVMRPWRYFRRLIGRDRLEDAEHRESPDDAATPPKGD